MGANKPLFRDLNADDPDQEATEVESLCMNCHATGLTRLLLTKIPFYREVVLMSFTCKQCGYQNNEIQSGAPMADKGVRYTLDVKTERDLNRQIVKSDYASISLVEIDYEIPSKSQKGEVTTVEGIISRIIMGLNRDQSTRRLQYPDVANEIDVVITQLHVLKDLKTPFTLILEDISGNSFIENPNAPKMDVGCSVQHFKRNKEQDYELVKFTREEVTGEKESAILHPISEGYSLEDLEGEVLHFPTNCFDCQLPCTRNIKKTNIPHFKEFVIMADNCDFCGYRLKKVLIPREIEEKGLRIELDVNSKDDLSRDILMSETCILKIPKLKEDFYREHAGRFTTVEGLLQFLKSKYRDYEDSGLYVLNSLRTRSKKLRKMQKKYDQVLEGRLPITIELEDPTGNSYVQSMKDDGGVDKQLRIIHYERSYEEDWELGYDFTFLTS